VPLAALQLVDTGQSVDVDMSFDWNVADGPARQEVGLVDETLRDGLQSPSVVQPGLDDKAAIAGLMVELGIQHANLGFPGAGRRAFDDVCALARAIVAGRLPLGMQCVARTDAADVRAALDAAQAVGVRFEVMTFIGSSPIRLRAEGWDVANVLERSREALRMATRAGLEVSFVAEDATRTPPRLLGPVLRNALDHGASRIVLCDTVGHSTPAGTARLVRFVRELGEDHGFRNVGIDFHGHNDRGLAVSNSLAAIEAGATRVHGCALGIGERAGNAAMDQLIANLFLMGFWRAIAPLVRYTTRVAEACKVPVPANYPVVGRDAFRTMSGVHAAAILKSLRMGDPWLADRVYGSLASAAVCRRIEVEVGPMSGASNVEVRLDGLGIVADGAAQGRVLAAAKANDRPLTREEIVKAVECKAE
jgi:2-isopropylmalate synthase